MRYIVTLALSVAVLVLGFSGAYSAYVNYQIQMLNIERDEMLRARIEALEKKCNP